MKVCLAVLLLSGALAAQPASVDGSVVDDTGGQPLAGVHISLLAGDFGNIKEAYGAISDRAGHFSIASIPAGSYIVLADRTGFLQARKADDPILPTLHLKAGQQLAGFAVRMAARAVIAGRVVDEAGDPVPGVNVQASASPGDPPLLLLRANLYTSTDDRGQFRLTGPPGKYYLKATPASGSGDPPEVRSDGSSEVSYGPTYYPGTAVPGRAEAVEAAAGRDVTGIEIRLVREQSLSIGGTVTGAGGATATVWLHSTEHRRAASTGPGGKFRFTRLPAGTYQLFAELPGKTTLQSQTVDVKLDGADENNVQLVLSPGGDLTGTLEMGGDAVAAKRVVRLAPVGLASGADGQIPSEPVESDGSFRMTIAVPPGRYTVTVNPMPQDAYVRAVLLDGVAAPDGLLDFSSGAHGSKIKVMMGRNGGQISGRVLDAEGGPAPGMTTWVLLSSNPAALGAEQSTRVSDGRYSFRGLHPGKYRVAALDVLRFAGVLEAGQEKDLLDRGDEIEIKEGDRITKDVKLTTKEAGHERL
jgi:hypothetical protein